jgi:hypothetical protein
MASLLAERPRSGPGGGSSVQHRTEPHRDDTDSGWLRRLRERRPEAAPVPVSSPAVDLVDESDAVRLDPQAMPPVPAVRPVTSSDTALSSTALGGDTIDAGSVAPRAGAYAVPPVAAAPRYGAEERSWGDPEESFDVLPAGEPYDGYAGPVTGETDIDEDGGRRHRLVVVGLPLLALLVVVGLAWWVGSTLLHVTGSVDQVQGSTPSPSAAASGSTAAGSAAAGAPLPIASSAVFDPLGDGQPENDKDLPKAYDGDPSTAWSTLAYRGSPAFGNLKAGVGLMLDLGTSKALSGVTIDTLAPGATVEIRTADKPADTLARFAPVAHGTLDKNTDLTFTKAVKARFVLVWITGLVPSANGFSADLAEVAVHAAG